MGDFLAYLALFGWDESAGGRWEFENYRPEQLCSAD